MTLRGRCSHLRAKGEQSRLHAHPHPIAPAGPCSVGTAPTSIPRGTGSGSNPARCQWQAQPAGMISAWGRGRQEAAGITGLATHSLRWVWTCSFTQRCFFLWKTMFLLKNG